MTKDKEAPGGRRRGQRQDPLGPNTEIARKLQQFYGSLVTDEVPDRFHELLSKLENSERDQDKG